MAMGGGAEDEVEMEGERSDVLREPADKSKKERDEAERWLKQFPVSGTGRSWTPGREQRWRSTR